MTSGLLLPFQGKSPVLGEGVFVAPTAVLVGDVTADTDASFWFCVAVRGDVNRITIGARTNIQDGSALHVTGQRHPLLIGSNVSIGHGAVVHGCTIEDGVLIGIGARVLDGAVVQSGSIVGAGALVPPGALVPRGHVALGIPARAAREVRPEESELIARTAEHYVRLKNVYLKSLIGPV